MIRRFAHVAALLGVAILVAACNPLGPAESTPTPVPTPVPTAPPTATPRAATDTPVPTATLAATDTPLIPSATPVALASATPVALASATAQANSTPAPTGTTAESTPLPATLAQLDKIEQQAAEVRGLKPKRDVPEHFITNAQMGTNLKKEIDDDYSPAEAKRDALELWLLRLLPDRNVDLYQIQVDLLSEQVLGYYDPHTKELYVRNDQQPLNPEAQETLAHEFVHSLQDEYYDLEKIRPTNRHDNDRDTAATALIEGDATLAGLLFAQKYMSLADLTALIQGSGNESTAALDSAPPYVRDSLLFPYLEGANFVSTLLNQDGFKAVDMALADPPVSTEQILHPSKYLTSHRDVPLAVTLPPLTATLGSGWTYDTGDTLGEFDLSGMLRYNGISESTAATAAAGWGGARFALYRKGDDGVVLLETVWDSAKEATEFDSSLRKSLDQNVKEGAFWTDSGRFFAERHTGTRVLYFAGTDQAALERVMAAVK
jgi:hypothetical protein